MGTFASAQVLESDDYRRILAVLDLVERASTAADFRRLVLEAVDEHLGYRRSTFVVGEPPVSGFKRFAGSTHGLRQADLEEYFERWTPDDPFVSLAATRRMRRSALLELTELADEVLQNERRYVEQFLLRQATSQLSCGSTLGCQRTGTSRSWAPGRPNLLPEIARAFGSLTVQSHTPLGIRPMRRPCPNGQWDLPQKQLMSRRVVRVINQDVPDNAAPST